MTLQNVMSLAMYNTGMRVHEKSEKLTKELLKENIIPWGPFKYSKHFFLGILLLPLPEGVTGSIPNS